MRFCLTGGIACGKSLLSRYLNELGIETLDADDVVHALLPADERQRLAKTVFKDPAARKALEARLHPLVKERLQAFLKEPVTAGSWARLVIIPLLFEVRWEGEFDIICCVESSRENQLLRLMTTRGLSREEAEDRLAAQLPVAEKAAKSHYVIHNDGSTDDLKAQARAFVDWLKTK